MCKIQNRSDNDSLGYCVRCTVVWGNSFQNVYRDIFLRTEYAADKCVI